jgi:hypothetical protein
MEIDNQSSQTLTFQSYDPNEDKRWTGGPVATIRPHDDVYTNFRYQSNTERKTGTLTYSLGGGHTVTFGVTCRWEVDSGSEVVGDTCDYSAGSAISCSNRITADKNDAVYTVSDPPSYCPWAPAGSSTPGQLTEFSGEIHCQEATHVAGTGWYRDRLEQFAYNGVQWYWTDSGFAGSERYYERVDGQASFTYYACTSRFSPPCQ